MASLLLPAFLVLSLVWLASCEYHHHTVCPEGGGADGCVTLKQLASDHSLVQSNTTLRFLPAAFNTSSVVRFVNVINLTLYTAGPHLASISFVTGGSGFQFYNVAELTIRNMVFSMVAQDHSNAMLTVTESANVLLQNITLKHGRGLNASNVYGNFEISNAVFTLMSSCLTVEYAAPMSPHHSSANLTVTNTLFSGNNLLSDVLGAVYIWFGRQSLPSRVHFVDVTFTNNTHKDGVSGIYIWCSSSASNHVTLERFLYTHNRVHGDVHPYSMGGSDIRYVYDGNVTDPSSPTNAPTIIEILDSTYVRNDYGGGSEAIDWFSDDHNLFSILYFFIKDPLPHVISVRNSSVSNNTGSYGAAILFESMGDDSKKDNLLFKMIDSNISNNSFSPFVYYKRGAVHLNSIGNITIHNCWVVNNSGTGVMIENSNVWLSGINVFSGNQAYNGGGMAFYYSSRLYLVENVSVTFENNKAENFGGGLYVRLGDSSSKSYDPYRCFVDTQNATYVVLKFNNNSAKTAGDDWYGGDLHVCKVTTQGYEYGWQLMTYIINASNDHSIDLTSEPLHVCNCRESAIDCIYVANHGIIRTVQTYPGKLFNLSVIAVGQLLNGSSLTGVPSAVYASILPLNTISNESASISEPMMVQDGKRGCSELMYRVSSTSSEEVMVLTVNKNVEKIQDYFLMLWHDSSWFAHVNDVMLRDLIMPAFVKIELLPCPDHIGFELSSDGNCDCLSSLADHVTNCSIDTLLLYKKPSTWLAPSDNFSTTFLSHNYCPFGYCKSDHLKFSLEDPDSQCNHNRSGVLCGDCKPGYSLVLGKMECWKCTNTYLLLLILFALAGILLVLFLSLTDMTVAAGTINGLLFYANVVRENQATLFPPQTAGSFLSVFIAWLNLDFGITTCFFDGLDAYVFTWLQLAFPIYIWLLAFGIIAVCRRYSFMNRVCGHNIVPVLATLFLLSYTKLQRTIATALSFTLVDVSDGGKHMVWLKDGNVPYLHGKHIPLFLVNGLLLLVFFIPYTLSITLGPWLQTKTQYRVLGWVLKWKPFFDAYFGPLKDRHRYWTGVLLLSRMILSVISAASILGSDSVNLLATIALTSVLLLAISGGVYKIWALSALDGFFLVNLVLLASVTLYNKSSNGSQKITVYISVGSAFAVFCLILLYHFLKRLEKCKPPRTMFRYGSRQALLEKINSDDEDVLNTIDEDRKVY